MGLSSPALAWLCFTAVLCMQTGAFNALPSYARRHARRGTSSQAQQEKGEAEAGNETVAVAAAVAAAATNVVTVTAPAGGEDALERIFVRIPPLAATAAASTAFASCRHLCWRRRGCLRSVHVVWCAGTTLRLSSPLLAGGMRFAQQCIGRAGRVCAHGAILVLCVLIHVVLKISKLKCYVALGERGRARRLVGETAERIGLSAGERVCDDHTTATREQKKDICQASRHKKKFQHICASCCLAAQRAGSLRMARSS